MPRRHPPQPAPILTKCYGCGRRSITAYCDRCAKPPPGNQVAPGKTYTRTIHSTPPEGLRIIDKFILEDY